MKDQDAIFFRNFSMLLGFLVLLTIVLAVVGYLMHNSLLGDEVAVRDRSTIAKIIEPAAKVNTGDAIVAQVAVEEEPKVAFDGSVDGAMIYNNVCAACHTSGLAGAPKLEAADWEARISLGLDGLVTSVINGKGAMPPRGGRADLSDEQIKATVIHMTKDFHPFEEEAQESTEAIATEAVAETKAVDVKQIYQTVCFACHGTGIAGAPKLETAAWAGRLEKGLDTLTESVINGIGIMPPRGGRMDLSDDEIKAVVAFMIKDL